MTRPLPLLAAAALVVAASAVGGVPGARAASAQDGPRVRCELSDDRLTEVSGITWSRRHPGTYWLHNDSGGGPYLYAVDGGTCRTVARVRVEGIDARDLEAVATGVAPGGDPVLWLADIGDNNDSWDSVRLHAVPEPRTLTDTTVRARTYEFTYADRPHDAEALLASPGDPVVWVVTKQLARGSAWRVPLRAGGVATARGVAEVRGLVTDAAYSPDGSRYVLRDYLGLTLHAGPVSPATLAAGRDIEVPSQPQGEAVTFTRDGTALLLVSEGAREVWEVPLDDAPAPSPTADVPATAPPSSDGLVDGTVDGGAAERGSGPVAYLLAGVAALAGVGLAVAAARRMRR